MKLGQKIICASFGESYYSVLKEQLLKMHLFIAVYPSGQMTQNGLPEYNVWFWYIKALLRCMACKAFFVKSSWRHTARLTWFDPSNPAVPHFFKTDIQFKSYMLIGHKRTPSCDQLGCYSARVADIKLGEKNQRIVPQSVLQISKPFYHRV